jgi:hypothetical protein
MHDHTTEEKKLAVYIAESLEDKEALTLYLSYAKKYEQYFLLALLERVLSIPKEKIKRTRGALFTFLVGQHGKDHLRSRD